jgi:hypothetical protein
VIREAVSCQAGTGRHRRPVKACGWSVPAGWTGHLTDTPKQEVGGVMRQAIG